MDHNFSVSKCKKANFSENYELLNPAKTSRWPWLYTTRSQISYDFCGNSSYLETHDFSEINYMYGNLSSILFLGAILSPILVGLSIDKFGYLGSMRLLLVNNFIGNTIAGTAFFTMVGYKMSEKIWRISNKV